jgi:predicted transglutaminase-like cysteine proteinase
MRVSKERGGKPQVASTDYVIYHSKKLMEKGFKTKDLAVAKATELMEKHLVKA